MAFKRKSFFGMKEREIISDLFASDTLREKVPGLADTQDAVAHHRGLMQEMEVLGELSKKYGEMRRVAGMNMATLVTAEEFHKAGCTCGRPVFGDGGHKEWFFAFLDLPGVKEKHDLRHETVLQ